jgi:hypothetical protein
VPPLMLIGPVNELDVLLNTNMPVPTFVKPAAGTELVSFPE